MRTYVNVLGVALMAVAAGCVTGGSDWEGSVTDSAGVTIVANTEQGMWGEGDAWTLTQELKLGALDDPDYQFAQIGFIAVDGHGSMYVLDAQAQQIQVYDEAGTYVRTIGGPGAGPGELGPGAVFLLIGSGDTLLVPDMGNQRVNLYGSGGESHGSFPLSFQDDGIPLAWRGTASGVVARQMRPLALPGQPAVDSMDFVVAQSFDGTAGDTLMKFASGGTFSFGGGAPSIKLYSAEPIWTIDDDLAVYQGVNDNYRISRYEHGVLTHIFSMPFARMQVTESDQDAVLGAIEDAWRNAGLPPAAIERARSIVEFGEYFPAFANIQIGPQGTLWVQHIQSVSELSEEERANFNLLEDSGAPEWDVFDPDGRYLGVVTMPHRFAPRLFVGDKLYGVWRDDLDVQYVVRLKIDQPSET